MALICEISNLLPIGNMFLNKILLDIAFFTTLL
jgi:hypothetical protein